ncbi:MAG TPA: restriction endonuclease [Opitutaceae bacterium]|nr:restriction endonuclease [Opitutaceae bacterium]
MPPKLALGLRACGVAAGFFLTTAFAAEQKSSPPPPAPSLIGASREQVLARFGEPKSNIVVGPREILFFEHDRIVLRNNVVTEVERLAAEPPRRPVAPLAAEAATASSDTAPDAADKSAPAPADKPAARASAPAAAAGPSASTPNTAAARSTPPASAAPVVAAAPTPPPAAKNNDAPLEIVAVRPAGSAMSQPEPPSQPPSAPAAPRAGTPPPLAVRETAKPAADSTSAPAAVNGAVTPPAEPAQIPDAEATAKTPSASAEPTDATAATPEAAPAPLTGKKAKAAKIRRRTSDGVEIPEPSFFSAQTYAIAFVVIVGGTGYLLWRRRQRQLELAATAVSRTPFTPAAAGGGGARFSTEFVNKLEWKRFEELVAAYYGKTGVVAVRTKTGPASPVHIRISWKGEPRPFACVQCISHASGLIDAKPLQELFAVLTAEDIRRGYVVTTGKFNVPARDFAEEKHLTLLPGDIFLEKLNALPDPARNELMQEISAGDYATPSCPKCEEKMVRSPDDSSVWHCAAHPDVAVRT